MMIMTIWWSTAGRARPADPAFLWQRRTEDRGIGYSSSWMWVGHLDLQASDQPGNLLYDHLPCHPPCCPSAWLRWRSLSAGGDTRPISPRTLNGFENIINIESSPPGNLHHGRRCSLSVVRLLCPLWSVLKSHFCPAQQPSPGVVNDQWSLITHRHVVDYHSWSQSQPW